MGNRVSFPICTSTQRKSKCISEMVSACLKLDNKWTDLHACCMDEAAQQKDYSLLCAAAAAAAARLENNHTPDTNFLSEDSLHLFAAKGTNRVTSSWRHRALGFMKKIKEICNQTNFPPGNIETSIFLLCVFPTTACQRERWDQFPQD